MMFSASLPHLTAAYVQKCLQPRLRKRAVSDRTAAPLSDTLAQPRLPLPCGQKTAASALLKRGTSLALVSSKSALTTGQEVNRSAWPPEPSTTPNSSASALNLALTALASGAECSPEQLAILQETYGSLKLLMPYLGQTFMGVEGLDLSNEEWHDVVQQYPLALARVPQAVLERCDDLYVQALCASQGSAEVIALLPTAHKNRLCDAAFQKDPALIGLLPVVERTTERCQAACILQPQALDHVPMDIQTEAFLEQVCDRNPDCFRYLSDAQKTQKLAMLVCKKSGMLLKEVPRQMRDDALCRAACLSYCYAIDAVPEDLFTEAFCQWIVHKNPMMLIHIPPEKMTAELCEYACARRPQGLACVPVDLRTDSLYQKVLEHRDFYLAYPHLPTAMVSEEICKRRCRENGDNLCDVPESFKNEEYYRIVTRQVDWYLGDIPEADRTREICLKSGIGRGCAFAFVPDSYINLDFLFSVMGGKDILALHTRAQKLLTEEHYTTFLCISALYRTETQLKLLTWSKLPDRFRRRLVDFLAGTGKPIALHALPQHSLINGHNPLRFELYNPMVSKLLCQAHMARHYQPVCHADGQAWLSYLKEQLPSYMAKPLPLIDNALCTPLKTGHIEKKGGRTLQVQDGDKIYYYKFQREDEPLEDLLREGLIHQFRAEHPQGAWGKLASDLPKDPHFFALPKSMWPQEKGEFHDAVAVQKEAGREEWVNVYRYTASADYGRYAHESDSKADSPFEKPENAIFTACYDMGLFASMGLMLTSMLPAMHNSDSGRSWQTLYDLFGDRDAVEVFPGTLGGWNGKATGHCDIGFNGLRDVGDYEQFGAIQSCFSKSENDGSVQPVAVGQRLAVAGTLCDNVMAAILIRSRLRQKDAGYHYKKEQAVDDTARFIGDVCDHLLTGLAGRAKAQVQPGITCKTMALDKQIYDQWLRRAALELIYWTAWQGDLSCSGDVVCGPPENGPVLADGWAADLELRGNASSSLYDPVDLRPRLTKRKYFINSNHEDNLGAHNSVFPLLSLVQGLTSLAGDILVQPPSLSPPQGSDAALLHSD